MNNSKSKNEKLYFILKLVSLCLFLSASAIGQTQSTSSKNLCKVKNWECAENIDILCKSNKPIWLNSQKIMQLVLKRTPIISGTIGKNNLYGHVTMRVLIDSKGEVVCVSGLKGHPIAKALAVREVHNWKFKAYEVNNKPVSVIGILNIPYDFRR